MNTRTPLIASALLAASLISGTAHAELQGRDLNGSIDSFEAYYDTDLNITWLADANYARTNGNDIVRGANGRMNWGDANIWAANLSFTDGVNVYDNWRLPTTLQPDTGCSLQSGGVSGGYGCTGSEMGHLYYTELGLVAGQPVLVNTGPFTNFQQVAYWTDKGYASNTESAFDFYFYVGYQEISYKQNEYYALAVSPGDVGIAAVPEPETYAMFLAGLGLVGLMVRRRKLAEV